MLFNEHVALYDTNILLSKTSIGGNPLAIRCHVSNGLIVSYSMFLCPTAIRFKCPTLFNYITSAAR